MLHLPNNCRAGNFSVRPRNWQTTSANWKSLWRISYWFFDDNSGTRIKVVIKGMNRLQSLKDKQDYVRAAINEEMNLIQSQGWNHVTKSFSPFAEPLSDIDGNTPLLAALDYAYSRLQVEHNTLADIKSCLKYIKQSVLALKYDRYRTGEIKRRHIKLILEKCGELKSRWSSNTFNHYRKYLSILFKELLEMDAIEINPVRDIQKKKQAHRMREQLTKKEREIIRQHLTTNDPAFWTYVNLFFHSGGREAELLRVKKSDVDLAGQRYKALIKKGGTPREEWCVIKDIVLDDWKRLHTLAQSGTDYLFSRDLLPGPKPIHRDRVTRRWEARVKKELGINKDLYALKHGNLDEMAEALQKHKESVQEASKAARHTTPVITLKHYLAGEQERQKLTVQKVWNEF